MNNNASSFLALVVADSSLRERVLAAVAGNQNQVVEQLAADAGFPATFEEISQSFRFGESNSALKEEELSDLELELVAGGRNKTPLTESGITLSR